MITLKKNGSLYELRVGTDLKRTASTWQELDRDAKELARVNRCQYVREEAVTPHDTNTIQPTSALRATGAGNLAVTFDGDDGDTAVVLASFPIHTAGRKLRVNRVRVTDTTSTGIVAIYEWPGS